MSVLASAYPPRMPTVAERPAETPAEQFERLCLTLEMAAGLDRDEAYRLLREGGKGLRPRSKLAKWYLKAALVILGEGGDDLDVLGRKK